MASTRVAGSSGQTGRTAIGGAQDDAERLGQVLDARQCREARTEGLLVEALAQTGSARAALRDKAIELNLDLATAVAARYVGRGVDRDDLVQVSCIGLVKAADGYVPGRGPGFAAYAVPTMSGELKRHFRDHGTPVRPPRRIQEVRMLVAGAVEGLRHDLGREPSDHEVADRVQIGVAEVADARLAQFRYRCLSLDVPVAPVDGDGGSPLRDQLVSVADPYAHVDVSDALRVAIGRLDARQRLIVRLRFVDELSQLEIGKRIGVSQMQVSRLLTSLVGDLRDALTEADRDADSDRPQPWSVGGSTCATPPDRTRHRAVPEPDTRGGPRWAAG